MTILDFVTILGNISQSLFPIQHLIFGGAYILGLLFFMTALFKLKEMGGSSSHSQTKMFTPMMYLLMGSALLYLPTALTSLANTAFGAGNILTYSHYNKANVFSSVELLVRTAGLLWFVRGSVLVAQASEPGAQDGPKGLVFIIAGILAINFDNTMSMINSILTHLTSWTLSVRAQTGY